LETAHAQARVDDGAVVVRGSHAAGAGRVVDGVGGAAAVLGQLRVGLHLRTGRDLTLEPALGRCGGGDLGGDLEPVGDGLLVVAGGVGEVTEVQRRVDLRVGAGQGQFPARTGPRDVGGHADRVAVLRRLVTETLRIVV